MARRLATAEQILDHSKLVITLDLELSVVRIGLFLEGELIDSYTVHPDALGDEFQKMLVLLE